MRFAWGENHFTLAFENHFFFPTALAAAIYSTCGRVGLTLYANEGVIGSQRELDRIAGEYVREELEELERELLCE